MSFFTNLFSSSKKKPTAEELIKATTVAVSQAVLEAIKTAPKPEDSRKRQAKDEPRPTDGKKCKETKKQRVEAAAEAPEPTEVKPTAEQEPVLISSAPAPTVLSLLTEREVACLSAEEAERKREEADKCLQTLVMNRVRLQHQNKMQQALLTEVNQLLGAITGTPVETKAKSQKEPREQRPGGPTCAAMTAKGRRCRRKPVRGYTKCTEHGGGLGHPPAVDKRPAPKPATSATSKPTTSKPGPSKPTTSKPGPSKPATSKPGPPSRRPLEDEEVSESDSEWVDSDVDE